MNNNIYFIEKKPIEDKNPFVGGIFYPVYMIKNNKEYFVCNRRETKSKTEQTRLENIKQQLINNNGKIFKFYSFYDDPLDLINVIIKRKHHFDNPNKLFSGNFDKNGFIDFNGNLKEVSCAFNYRIYDFDIINKIKELIKHIDIND